MRRIVLALLAAGIATPLLGARPTPRGELASPCTFGRGNPIPENSGWQSQFKCYQSSGRHVTVVGSGSFEAGTVSGGLCVISATPDRAQIAACGSFGGDAAMIVPYTSIGYLIDDPRSEVVNVYLTALFHH